VRRGGGWASIVPSVMIAEDHSGGHRDRSINLTGLVSFV